MKNDHPRASPPMWKQIPHPGRAGILFILGWLAFLALVGLGPALEAQDTPPEPQTLDSRKCQALASLNLETVPGGPAVITSAHIVEVPATGLEHFIFTQSGYGSPTPERASHIREYCNVTGYVAPQNKFVLKLPLPGDWNQKFFFYACGGFCGTLFTDAPNLGLARGPPLGTEGMRARWDSMGFGPQTHPNYKRILGGGAIT
jgi:hypothetical protein